MLPNLEKLRSSIPCHSENSAIPSQSLERGNEPTIAPCFG